MRYFLFVAMGLVLWTTMPTALNARSETMLPGSVPTVTILADPSLTLPITELAREYARNQQIIVSTVFASSKAQSESISKGMEADIFITARGRYIQTLQNQGLIDVYSLTNLAKNRLALASSLQQDFAVSFDGTEAVAEKLSRHNPDYVFAIGDAEFVTSGSAALTALFNLGEMEDIEPRLVFLQSVRLLHDVIRDNNYGFTFASDAEQDDELTLLTVVPESAHQPIMYQGVVVAGENMSAARKLLDHLRSDEAKKVFTHYGLLPATL